MHDVRLLKMAAPMKASEVADLVWLQARVGQRLVVLGLLNKVFAFLPRISPQGITTRIAAQVMGKH